MASDTHSGWQYSYSTNPQYPTNQPPPSKTIDLLFIHEINLVIKSLLLNLHLLFLPIQWWSQVHHGHLCVPIHGGHGWE